MEMLNPELEPFLEQNKLSEEQIKDLVQLKEMVDRLSSTRYASDETVEEMERKFGTKPNIITWGDYFQAEVATAHYHRNDDEFAIICQTIYFDLISSILIFTGKPVEFFKHVASEAGDAQTIPRDNWTIEDEEKVHLDILANYFRQMGLKEAALTDRDYEWFHGFAAAKAV